jgi:hypothetical protein
MTTVRAGDGPWLCPQHEDQPAPWVPAFPGQRPPTQPGNELAVRHGAYSPRKVDPLAAQLVALVLDDDAVSYLRAPRYAAGLWGWARAEARVQLVDEYVADRGLAASLAHKPGTRSLLELLDKFERTAAGHRARLGLDPLSAARLARDLVSTAVVAQGATARLQAAGERFLDVDDTDPNVSAVTEPDDETESGHA